MSERVDEALASFLATLFNPNETLACANRLQDCKAQSQALVMTSRPQWVSVNPFKVWKTNDNVTSFRNLVVEYDRGLSVDEQLPFMISKGFPFSTAVHSGNKSIHFVCALSEPLKDFEEFREVRRWLDIIFPGADKQVKDPARFTRSPGGVNVKTGVTQELIVLDKRVSPSRLAAFLARNEDKVKAHDEAQARLMAAQAERISNGELSASQWRFLRGEEGVRDGASRHARLFAIVCDMQDIAGLDYAEALALANECADLQGISQQLGRESEAEKIVYDVYFKRAKTLVRGNG